MNSTVVTQGQIFGSRASWPRGQEEMNHLSTAAPKALQVRRSAFHSTKNSGNFDSYMDYNGTGHLGLVRPEYLGPALKAVHFDRSGYLGRSERNVPFHLTKLLSPVPLFCILLTRTINKRMVAWVGSVQPECTVALGTWNFRNFKPKFLLNWKRPRTANIVAVVTSFYAKQLGHTSLLLLSVKDLPTAATLERPQVTRTSTMIAGSIRGNSKKLGHKSPLMSSTKELSTYSRSAAMATPHLTSSSKETFLSAYSTTKLLRKATSSPLSSCVAGDTGVLASSVATATSKDKRINGWSITGAIGTRF